MRTNGLGDRSSERLDERFSRFGIEFFPQGDRRILELREAELELHEGPPPGPMGLAGH